MTNNALVEVRNTINKMEPEFKKALPTHIAPEKFTRVAMSAITNNPLIANAERNSLMASCLKAAQDGLVLDGREAALVMFKNKRGQQQAQYMPMVSGLMKKARNSGEISTLTAEVVYENDEFQYHVKNGVPFMYHEPNIFSDRGKPIGVYASAVLKDGGVMTEVLSMADVEKVRNVSRAKNSGPWQTWWDEMARKTAIRRLSKRLPSSSDVEQAIHADDELFMPPEPVDVTPPKEDDAEPKEKPKAKKKAPSKGKTKAAQALEESEDDTEEELTVDDDDVIDAEYSEVEEGGEEPTEGDMF